MSTPFSQPGAGGDKFDLKNHGNEWIGALMLVYPLELIVGFDSGEYEPTDVVRGDVILIDRKDPETGDSLAFYDTMLFSKGLVANTRNEVGGVVLGRLNKKQFRAGTGWTMEPYADNDALIAQEYIRTHPRNAPAQPAQSQPPAPAPAPPPDPWAVPPTAAAAAAPAAVAPPLPTAPPPAGLNPQLKAFLDSKGLATAGLDNATAQMLAASFPDAPK